MYSIEINIDYHWETLCETSFENISIVKEKPTDRIFSRIKVTGAIICYGGDYTALLNRSEYKLPAKLLRFGVVVVEGELNLRGKWDVDNKKCELDFMVVDEYTDVMKEMDTEWPLKTLLSTSANLKATSERKEVQLLKATYPEMLPEQNNYKFDSYSFMQGDYWIYAKQLIQFPADGWDNDLEMPDYVPNPLFPIYKGYSIARLDTQNVTRDFRYFYYLENVLKVLCEKVGISVNVNSYSSYLSSKKLFICYKSNLLKPDNFEKKTNITLAKILDIYKSMFNLDWIIIGENLYLKHPTEINYTLPVDGTLPSHDITTANDVNWSQQKSVYTYKKELPYKEVWETEKTQNEDFDGMPILYDAASDKEIKVPFDVQTNFMEIISGNDSGLSEDGYCVVSCDNLKTIIITTGILTGDLLINGEMALSQLHKDNFISGGRYADHGKINGRQYTFPNARRLREIQEVVMAGNIDDFNFDYLVKTDLGECELISVTEDKTGAVKIKAIY